uniref:Uncharacterized protein n=1 Tax=Branchiostoma floridae TaxID=7739 RepID=C3ZJT0_BRAFL|eukprot:XP_002591204.1 hypothetical protein BRAFLDRAFT_105406 [Branchiostoma floridae]
MDAMIKVLLDQSEKYRPFEEDEALDFILDMENQWSLCADRRPDVEEDDEDEPMMEEAVVEDPVPVIKVERMDEGEEEEEEEEEDDYDLDEDPEVIVILQRTPAMIRRREIDWKTKIAEWKQENIKLF